MPAPLTNTTTTANGVNVEFMLPELAERLEQYEIIRDCLAGQEAVKKKKTKYLPKPNAHDDSPENNARYEGYLTRAIFYNVTANTAAGLVGQVFNADPVTEFPSELDPVWYDATGNNVSMTQQAKRALSSVLAYGRCGLLTDFPAPKEDGSAFTRAEILEGIARPTIQFYGPTDVINWRYKQVGALSVLSLVVLNENYIIEDDGFEIKTGEEKRVLRLDGENLYVVEQWRRQNDEKEGAWYVYKTHTPRDYSGNRLSYIPFTFVGSQNNDSSVDRPPLYDLACLNIGHYRNSADYEDSVYMVGQPTPFFSGLTREWVDEVLKGTIQLGSRGAVPLPEGGQAGLIQAAPNSMVKEAMELKQKQMIAIGAQLVEDKQVQRTLGEAKMEQAIVASVLTSCANNVSAAFEACVKWACDFFGIEDKAKEDVVFRLSTDFAIAKLSPQDRQQLLAEWQAGLVSFSEARGQLRQSGVATLDDDEAKEEIAGDKESRVDLDEEGVDTDDNADDQGDEE